MKNQIEDISNFGIKLFLNFILNNLFYNGYGCKPTRAKEFLSSALNIKGELADTQDTNEVLFTLSAESNDQVNNWAEEPEKAAGTIYMKGL